MIRTAKKEDAEALIAIYAPYVIETAITFEYDVPNIEDFEQRIQNISSKYPYLVYEENGNILGYAYASSYKERKAYQWSCEVSIYVNKLARGRQVGTKLYDALEEQLVQQKMVNLLACITYPNVESISFHKKRGYQKVAHVHDIGFKHGKWHDIVWMQKCLLENKDNFRI